MNKKNLYLGIAFVILLSMFFLYGPVKNWKNNFGKASNFLSDLEVEAVNKVKVSYHGSEIELLKQGEKWQIASTKDFYVDDSTSHLLNEQLTILAKADFNLVSENKDKKGSFQTDESGAKVEIFYNDESLKFVVGKVGVSFGSTYISREDDDSTYLLSANISSLFNREEWRDRKIFSSNREEINKIRFQYPDSEFTIEKNEDGWAGTLPYKFTVDDEGDSLVNVLNLMSNLSAQSIPAQSFDGTGLEEHSIIIEASSDNYTNTIMVGGIDDNGAYFVKRGDSDNIYLIDEVSQSSFDIRIKDLK